MALGNTRCVPDDPVITRGLSARPLGYGGDAASNRNTEVTSLSKQRILFSTHSQCSALMKVIRSGHQFLPAFGTPAAYEAGTLLYDYGDPVDRLYLVREGRVAASVLSSEGRELVDRDVRSRGTVRAVLPLPPARAQRAGDGGRGRRHRALGRGRAAPARHLRATAPWPFCNSFASGSASLRSRWPNWPSPRSGRALGFCSCASPRKAKKRPTAA